MARATSWVRNTLFALGLVGVMTATAQATTITIINLDGPGEGFNDTTPRAPEGGNPGTTRGAQRLNAFNEAANRWAAVLDSGVPIEVGAAFDPLNPCDAGGALLGSAGPNTVHVDFPGAPLPSVLFVQAQANSHAGVDLDPSKRDIDASFNSDIDLGCLPGFSRWYYGFDGSPPAGTLDLIPTLLHEMAHGLGFLTLVDLATGAKLSGLDDTYMRFLEDHSTGEMFPTMTNAERILASTNSGNLHWVGANVAAKSGVLSAGRTGTHVHIYAPDPQQPGSSVSHWDTTLTPDELMEPADTATNIQDLTEAAFADMGWRLLTDPLLLCGDANDTGTVTVTDSVQVLRAAAESPTTCTPSRCDFDGNGTIGVTDGVNILRAAIRLPPSAPPNCP